MWICLNLHTSCAFQQVINGNKNVKICTPLSCATIGRGTLAWLLWFWCLMYLSISWLVINNAFNFICLLWVFNNFQNHMRFVRRFVMTENVIWKLSLSRLSYNTELTSLCDSVLNLGSFCDLSILLILFQHFDSPVSLFWHHLFWWTSIFDPR